MCMLNWCMYMWANQRHDDFIIFDDTCWRCGALSPNKASRVLICSNSHDESILVHNLAKISQVTDVCIEFPHVVEYRVRKYVYRGSVRMSHMTKHESRP